MSSHLTDLRLVLSMSGLHWSSEHVSPPIHAVCRLGHTDQRHSKPINAETTLRQVVGSRLLQTIITDREGLAAEIQEIVSTGVLRVTKRHVLES